MKWRAPNDEEEKRNVLGGTGIFDLSTNCSLHCCNKFEMVLCLDIQDFGVWMVLLEALDALILDDHPHQWFNIKVLLKAGTVQRLLEGLLFACL